MSPKHFLSTSAVFEIRILWSKINPFVMRCDILTANKIQVSALLKQHVSADLIVQATLSAWSKSGTSSEVTYSLWGRNTLAAFCYNGLLRPLRPAEKINYYKKRLLTKQWKVKFHKVNEDFSKCEHTILSPTHINYICMFYDLLAVSFCCSV